MCNSTHDDKHFSKKKNNLANIEGAGECGCLEVWANNFSLFLFLSLKFHRHQVYYSRLGTLAERSRRQAHLHFHSHGELLILGNVSEVILGGLRPWSRYQVQLAVLNGRGEGPRSEAMEFVTPEGGKNRRSFTLGTFHLCFPPCTF